MKIKVAVNVILTDELKNKILNILFRDELNIKELSISAVINNKKKKYKDFFITNPHEFYNYIIKDIMEEFNFLNKLDLLMPGLRKAKLSGLRWGGIVKFKITA